MASKSFATSEAARFLLIPWILVILVTSTSAQLGSKRGISVLGDNHQSDWSLLTSKKSPLTWYYNWSPYPSQSDLVSSLEFFPLIHNLDNIKNDIAQAKSLPSSSTHLLTFNEPDGSTASGGSSISPDDAAKAYIDQILPLRKSEGGRFLISHPSTTGSGQGLDWLKRFNASCYMISPSKGCPLDFITAHWYGSFPDLASWLGQLDEFYNGNTSSYRSTTLLKIWITEFALPQANENATVQMMNQSLPYLDGLDYVSGYAWFGMFRKDESNAGTGKQVAMFQDNGALTQLGATYLNGAVGAKGTAGGNFTEGQKGSSATRVCVDGLALTMMGSTLWFLLDFLGIM